MLAIESIDLHYGAAQALRKVSMIVERGRISALLGRNGVGKTSLLRAVAGHQAISSGRIVWEGEEISRLAPYQRARRGIAYVPQGREIFPLLTVRENLETGFAPLKKGERTLPEEIFVLFPVLKSMLRRRGGDLSGGQQQQLSIARALTMRPRLLILDEPTEGVQPSIIKEIGHALSLLRARGDMAILLVEQYYDFAKSLADDLSVMERGEIALSGPTHALADEDVRRRMSV